jgi:hypothetical protein
MNIQLLREPVDKICFTLIVILSLIISLLVGGSKICIKDKCLFNNYPQVKEFSWENQKISAQDKAFILTFDRPMDQKSVEENLVIEPMLPGKISWAGRRLVYTLNFPIPYGQTYRLSLRNAYEKFRITNKKGTLIEPFVAEFASRDRAFAYIGSEGEELGKLIIYNSTKQNKTILSSEDLAVVNFKFSANGEYIIFSASEKSKGIEGLTELDLYRVTTGLPVNGETKIPGEVELILDHQDYQNNQFEVAGEKGEIIVVQRINRDNPNDFDLWLIKDNNPPKPLNHQGGDFLITPDGKAIAIAQGEGIAIIPLEERVEDSKPLDFLAKYGRILAFSKDGRGAAMVNFNKDNQELRYTKSLFYINNQGIEKELINLNGSIIDCDFNPSGDQLYCLLTKVVETEEEFQEEPYFVLIEIDSGQIIPLVFLPSYQDIKLSIAPDGFGILFNQIITSEETAMANPSQSKEENVSSQTSEIPPVISQLWLLTLPSLQSPNPELQELSIHGLDPKWSP